MSATGRSDVRDVSDVYETPGWCVRRLLEHVELPGGYWLEPSAGSGAIIRAVNEVRQDISWTAVEMRPECLVPLRTLNLASVLIDSFTVPWRPLGGCRFDVVIGNPPYKAALRFVQQSLELASVVVMLLRLNWLASEERAAWMREHTPSVYVLPNRPSFTGGSGDATEYAWMLWRHHQASHRARGGRIQVLKTTPAAERSGRATPRERGQRSLFGDVA
jgi:hypothetical protein